MPLKLWVLLWLLALGAGCTAATTPIATPIATPLPLTATPTSTSLPVTPALSPTPGASALPSTVTPTGAATLPALTPTPISISTPASTPTGAPPAALHLAGYFFGSDRNNHVLDIAASELTDVLYAFVDVTSAGECASINAALDQTNFPQLQQLKQQHPLLKALISLGGYSHSTYFSDAALSDGSRRHFVQSCVQFMQQRGLDGIDVDWELPVSGGQSGNVHRPQDKQNFTALLAEFRRQLDALGANGGRHYLLTIAGPAGGPSEYATMELGTLQQYLDWINLETYAYTPASSPLTNLLAPLYDPSAEAAPGGPKRSHANADAAVRAYVAMGVPAAKIVLGVPFYGRGWEGVPSANNGLYEPDTGPATDAGVPRGTWSDGAIFYRDLARYYLNTYTRYRQAEAQAPWLYSAAAGIMITYDDPQSLAVKADYVKTNGLGGVMIWHVSADDTQHSLLNALYARLFP